MADPTEVIRDELLVLDCLKGSSDAFRALVTRWQEPLWRHAYRLTGRDDAAWDVLQEAWIGMANGIQKLQEPRHFRRWAYTIVTRRAADWASTQRNNGLVADLDESVPAADPVSEPSSAVEALREALKHLPPEPRVLLSLRYVDEFELSEIAEILGIPEGTVKSRLHHARSKLREIIERMEP